MGYTKIDNGLNPDALDVISEPRDMFEDLVSRLTEQERESLGRISPLRVATMCSVGREREREKKREREKEKKVAKR